MPPIVLHEASQRLRRDGPGPSFALAVMPLATVGQLPAGPRGVLVAVSRREVPVRQKRLTWCGGDARLLLQRHHPQRGQPLCLPRGVGREAEIIPLSKVADPVARRHGPLGSAAAQPSPRARAHELRPEQETTRFQRPPISHTLRDFVLGPPCLGAHTAISMVALDFAVCAFACPARGA
jgi:hypothetical protein